MPLSRRWQSRQAIAEYLDTKEHESQLISSAIESQIATLTAYRKSLIHECVTGQRRITEAGHQTDRSPWLKRRSLRS